MTHNDTIHETVIKGYKDKKSINHLFLTKKSIVEVFSFSYLGREITYTAILYIDFVYPFLENKFKS